VHDRVVARADGARKRSGATKAMREAASEGYRVSRFAAAIPVAQPAARRASRGGAQHEAVEAGDRVRRELALVLAVAVGEIEPDEATLRDRSASRWSRSCH
jgi:hypothetical protein